VTALVPVIVISATQVALFGIVLPLLMLGPVVASRTRPQPQQLAFAALLLIPTLLLSSGFLAWWAVSWMDAVEAPVPALTGIGLVVAVTAGLLAPLRLPGASGPFWLKPLLGFSAGVLVPVAIMESVLVGLPTFAAAAVGAAVLGLLVVVLRLMARPMYGRSLSRLIGIAKEAGKGACERGWRKRRKRLECRWEKALPRRRAGYGFYVCLVSQYLTATWSLEIASWIKRCS
jgi:hypothetical protein